MTKHLLALFLYASSAHLSAQTAIEFVGAPESDDYQIELLQQVLDSTVDSHGPYTLTLRAQASDMREAKLVGDHPALHRISVTPKIYEHIHNADLKLVPIPSSRGILGYRVCYSSKQKAKKLEETFRSGDLSGIRFGSGHKWSDTDILRKNGLVVIEAGWDMVPSKAIDSLYKMTARGRIDAFCRGINEVLRERTIVQDQKNLMLNTSHVLAYNMPFFFYVHTKNTALFERLTNGLELLLDNGKFEAHWNSYHLNSVEFTNLENRDVIRLKTSVDIFDTEEYRRYLFIK